MKQTLSVILVFCVGATEIQRSINQWWSYFIMPYLLINRRHIVHLYRTYSTVMAGG